MSRQLIHEYHGNLLNMYDDCDDDKDFVKRLQRLKGVGPKTAEIFMREAQPVLVQTNGGRSR
jgi:3-methyladenine DNA glycosylase/8-oxoguanine DNA glycosylase